MRRQNGTGRQLVGETGVGEMGVGEMGIGKMGHFMTSLSLSVRLASRTRPNQSNSINLNLLIDP